jgi:hypothetical protein
MYASNIGVPHFGQFGHATTLGGMVIETVAIFTPAKELTRWRHGECEPCWVGEATLQRGAVATPDNRRARLKIAPASDGWLHFLFMHNNPQGVAAVRQVTPSKMVLRTRHLPRPGSRCPLDPSETEARVLGGIGSVAAIRSGHESTGSKPRN